MARPQQRADKTVLTADTRDELEGIFGRIASSLPLRAGTQASVQIILLDDGSEIAVKMFNAGFRYHSKAAVEAEYCALGRFYRALASAPSKDVRCPEALALLSSAEAYVMSRVAGQALLTGRVRYLPDAWASQLLTALNVYHRSIGSNYGDLQPRNLLVSPTVMSLVDPTMPDPFHQDPIPGRPVDEIAKDVGYWIYSVALALARHPSKALLTRPNLSLASDLLAETSRCYSNSVAMDAIAVSHAFVNENEAAGPRRRKFLGTAIRRILGLVARPFVH